MRILGALMVFAALSPCIWVVWRMWVMPDALFALITGKYQCIGRGKWRIRLFLCYLNETRFKVSLGLLHHNNLNEAYAHVYALEFAQQCKVLGFKKRIGWLEDVAVTHLQETTSALPHFSWPMLDRLYTVLNEREPHVLNPHILSALVNALDLTANPGILQKYRTHILSDTDLKEKFIERCVRDADLRLLKILVEPTQPIVRRMYDVHEEMKCPQQWMYILAFLEKWDELFLLSRGYEMEDNQAKADECLRILASRNMLQVRKESRDKPASPVQK